MKEMPKHNYAQLDKMIKMTFYDDRLQIAKKLGYAYVSEGIIKTYRKIKSQRKTGAIFEYTYFSIRLLLIKFNEPRYPSGGYRPGDKRYGKPAQSKTGTGSNTTNPDYQPFG